MVTTLEARTVSTAIRRGWREVYDFAHRPENFRAGLRRREISSPRRRRLGRRSARRARPALKALLES